MRILIADHDDLSRAALRQLLSEMKDLELVCECTDGSNILERAAATHPEIVFADMQLPHLPDLNDFYSERPMQMAIIAIIADEGFGLHTLEQGAVDFIVKPVSRAGITRSLIRAHHFMTNALNKPAAHNRRFDYGADFSHLLQSITRHLTKHKLQLAPDKFPVKVGTHVKLIHLRNILYANASGDYIDIVMTTGERIHTKEKMVDLQVRLPSGQFIRTHRSFIINKEHVKEIRAKNNDYELTLVDGTVIASGPTYRASVRNSFLVNFAS